MQASVDSLEFVPPREPAAARSLMFAVLAHLLLLLALTWGVNWKRASDTVAAEAELWSSIPQPAAPAPPAPVVQAPPLPPPPVVQTPPAPPVTQEADIALERDKKKREDALKLQQEQDAARKRLEAQKKQQEEALKREQLAQQKAVQDRKQREDAAKLAKDKARQVAEAKKVEADRQANLKKMLANAGGGSGTSGTPGSASRSSGPSASYAGRIAGRIRPNIVFTEVVSANPSAEVQLRVAPDGTIVARKLVKSSGVRSWDDAVLRAIDKTDTIPRDTDGSIVPDIVVTFRPRDVP
jgi:colicin import membrane protein